MFLSSCKKKLCVVDRYDIGEVYSASNGVDSFYFRSWKMPLTSSSSFPSEILDSMKKLENTGYTLTLLTPIHISFAECECDKIKSLNPQNNCHETP